ncbi:MAG: hypothetical protein R3F20_12120 [Planctomycetota bacterium]
MTRRRTRILRLSVGLLFWAGLLAWAGAAVGGTEIGRRVLDRGLAQLTREPSRRTVGFPASAPVAAGAALRIEVGGHLLQAGEVLAVRRDGDGLLAEVALYPDFAERTGDGGRLVAYTTRGDIAWILATLFPAELREEVRRIFLARWESERGRLLGDLRPGLERLAGEVAGALREDLPRVLEDNDREFEALAAVLRERGWEAHAERVVREEIWPSLRDRATPLVTEIGEEMIAAFPVGSAAWDLFVDKLPFSEERRVRERLRGFAQREAIPILRSHEGDFRAIASEVLREAVDDPEIRRAVGLAAEEIAADPRFRDALAAILRNWVVENDRVAGILGSIWTRPDLRDPLQGFLERLTPEIHRIANRVVLDEEGRGINPELARVLRRKILREDERWILVAPEAGATDWRGEDGGVR